MKSFLQVVLALVAILGVINSAPMSEKEEVLPIQPKCEPDTADTLANGEFDQKCVFPFKYQGTRYKECTTANWHRPWCSIEVEPETNNYISGRWGNCGCNSPHCSDGGNLVADTMGNGVFSNQCVLPFTYVGIQHSSCTKAGYSQPWCPFETDENREYIEGKWGVCSCSGNGYIDPNPEPVEENKAEELTCNTFAADTRANGKFNQSCVFPFRYNGVVYDDCTNAEWHRPWCSLKVEPDTQNYIAGSWGNCECVDGYCPEGSKLVADSLNDGNYDNECVFPFTYEGKLYSTCTIAAYDALWCSVETNEEGEHLDGKWGVCGCSRVNEEPIPIADVV